MAVYASQADVERRLGARRLAGSLPLREDESKSATIMSALEVGSSIVDNYLAGRYSGLLAAYGDTIPVDPSIRSCTVSFAMMELIDPIDEDSQARVQEAKMMLMQICDGKTSLRNLVAAGTRPRGAPEALEFTGGLDLKGMPGQNLTGIE